jgi:ribosomal protein S14
MKSECEEVMIIGEGIANSGVSMASNEQSFIVKRQKRCNFCGEELPYPKKFTF